MKNYLKYIIEVLIVLVVVRVLWLSFTTDSALVREQLFNDEWQFKLDTDTEWREVMLPHDWSVEGDFNVANAMGDPGGYLPDGKGVYRKEFKIGKKEAGKRFSLYFEGAYENATIFVNGINVGLHRYGYTSFAYDITPFVKIGEKNEVEVRIDNSAQNNCRWYSGSGLYRNVWLVTTDPVHIKQWSNYITTPRVSESMATVFLKTTVMNESDTEKKVLVRADFTDNYYAEREVTLAAGASEEVELVIDVYEPRLWSPATPNLYNAKISVTEGKKVLDTVNERFGIRKIDYSVDNGFQLNGETMKVFGGCVHHDNGILGAAAFRRAEYRRVEMLKEAGFNAVRTSHNPVSVDFLDACDSIGLMVIDESFDGWMALKTPNDYHLYMEEDWQKDLDAMVLRDRNHPSIIAWSIGNEIIERDEPVAVELAAKFGDYIRSLDPTRPITQALACWNDKWVGQDNLAAQHEVIGYNYLLGFAAADHERVPERIIWQTESFPRDVLKNWLLVKNNDYIIGDFVWTAIDYIGESSIGRWYYEGDTPGEHYQGTHFPWHGAYCGDIDLTGWRKPVSYYRQLLFANESAKDIYMAVKEPDGYHGQIHVTAWGVWPTWESWNWEGWEGKPIDVEVYSKYPMVRLYLNGRLVGEQANGEENGYNAVFNLPYEPGTIKAVGVTEGKESEDAVVLATAGQPVALRATADRTTITSDGEDLSFVTVEVVDNEGRVCPNAEIPFSCQIFGAATIAGIGNANLQDTDPYYDLSHKTWKGRAMVVVRSKKKSNSSARLQIKSESLKGAVIEYSLHK